METAMVWDSATETVLVSGSAKDSSMAWDSVLVRYLTLVWDLALASYWDQALESHSDRGSPWQRVSELPLAPHSGWL
jgi:hypothetical protein